MVMSGGPPSGRFAPGRRSYQFGSRLKALLPASGKAWWEARHRAVPSRPGDLALLSIFDNISSSVPLEAAMPSSFAIGKHFEHFIRSQVEGGRYASASEVVRDALRLLEQREQHRETLLEALRAEIRAGLESGQGAPADQVFDRLEEKYSNLARGRE